MLKAISFLLLLFLPFTVAARNMAFDCDERDTFWKLTVRGAYYHPSSRPIKKIFSSGWIDYQIESSFQVIDFVEVWGGVAWSLKQHGHFSSSYEGFKIKTKMYVLPLSLGVKFIYPILPCVDFYLGAGGCYSFLKIHAHRPEDPYSESDDYSGYSVHHHHHPKRDIYKSGFGGVFKVGFQWDLGDNVFLDLFVDYFSQRFSFSRHDRLRGERVFKRHVDCSGFKYGAGVGVYF